MKKAIDILFAAKQDGVDIVLNGDDLHVKVPKDRVIDRDLIADIRNSKQLIIDFLKRDISSSNKSYSPIKPFDRQEISIIPLSHSQERLWFIHQLEGGEEYNLSVQLKLRGILDKSALAYALQAIVHRHEVLRTALLEKNGATFQQVMSADSWSLSYVNATGFSNDSPRLKHLVDAITSKAFDLSKDYMLRATLVTLNHAEYLLSITMHHIASDAWSMPIIVDEVTSLYQSFIEGKPDQLAPLALQYADYAVWERSNLKGDILDNKLAYWKNKLKDVSPLQMPTDFIRPAAKSTKGAATAIDMDKELSGRLHQLARQYGSSLYMVLLAAFKVLLHRYSGQQDICVGASIANRSRQELERLVGFFVNTLAFRSQVDSDVSFLELLQQVRATAMEAYEHQEVPFDKVVETVLKERDPSRSPIFQVMLVLKNTPDTPEIKAGGLTITEEQQDSTHSKFDFTFFVTENSDGLRITVEYSTDLYKEETISRMLVHYKELLSSIVKMPEQKVGLLRMLPLEEEKDLLASLTGSTVIYPKDKSIATLFEEQVIKNPEMAAVVFEGAQYSYHDLNERANRLAHYLHSKGVRDGSLVPLCIERGLDMMIGILGILKSGAAYVPIDVDFPAARIGFMLQDSRAAIVVSSSASRHKIETATEEALEIIETDDYSLSLQPGHNRAEKVHPGQLAYVIYTSGSTGNPKGVLITHANLVDYVFGLEEKVQVSQCRSYALVSTIATDLGNTVVYSSLVFGGTLHLLSKDGVSNTDYLHNYFTKHAIDCLKIVPSHWQALRLNDKPLLPKKLLIFGGEALQAAIVEDIRLAGTNVQVVNHYGPTETTIGKLLHAVSPGKAYSGTIPIGRPFSNTGVYVLSPALQLCPAGVPGQLYIGGDGLAQGYLNNEELTRAKFIQNPYEQDPHRVLYATGDLVKNLSDGNIEFIGRVDDQVKIRGYRVELGEVENILHQSELVSQAVVVAREDRQGNKRLVGYVVAEDVFDREGVLSYLREKLPEYMIPAVLVELESLPLTANGKIDKRALPDPEAGEEKSGQYIAPRNETETKLATIWQDVLEVEQVGMMDDFFELGGHSLLAVRLISAIRKEFTVEIPISHVFDYPTIALLAEQLQVPSSISVLPAMEVVSPRPDQVPLSFSQERLWFIDRMEGSVQYHVPAVLRLKGKLNIDALGGALQQIVDRHEALRTVFIEQDGQAYQYIKEKSAGKLEIIEGDAYEDDIAGLQAYIQELINQPFDLSSDDMIRVHLIELGDQEYILVVTLHHIASDGWSRSILVKEVAELYTAINDNRKSELSPLKLQYADYAIWQRKFSDEQKKIDYWKNKLDGVAPLQLPTDHKRPVTPGTQGSVIHFHLQKELSGQLQELSRQEGTTLFMTILSAFNVLLHRYSGQQDICVGTPVAGRQQQEVEALIGFFVNTLALRSEVSGDTTFNELLKQVRSNTLEAYANQEVPLEKVIEVTVKERDFSRSPLFQVMLVLRNTPEIPALNLGDVQLTPENFSYNIAKFDITIYITETTNGLQGSIEYRTELFNCDTIERMALHFENLLHSIVQSPGKRIGDLGMLSVVEEHELLVELNNTYAEYPKNETIIALFERQVAKTPEATALMYDDIQVSYQELNEKANQLAHCLISKGVAEETLVPVCIDRSVEMVVGILGILKAGGAYVPIEPGYPVERIRYMLEDIVAKVLVTNSAFASSFFGKDTLDIINVDKFNLFNNWPSGPVTGNSKAENTVFIGYTSGSTGKPKGVRLTNAGIINRLYWTWHTYPYADGERSALKTSVGFVDHICELFGPLLKAIPSVLFRSEDVIDMDVLIKKLASNKISRWVLVPSLLKLILDKLQSEQLSLPDLKYWTSSGEALTGDLTENFYKVFPASSHTLLNIYGSSEVTADATYYDTSVNWVHGHPGLLHSNNSDRHEETGNIERQDEGMRIPIGKPIANCQVYILDSNTNLLPKGLPGEICVGGIQVAKGYLNQPELTAAKFILNPFNNDKDAKLYKTGDLGRWLPDGNIEYLGRLDDQVKIRGQRVELSEIENVLLQSGIVSQGVVLAKDDKEGNNRLVGYVVVVAGNAFDKEALISYLKNKLPGYMVPYLWITLDRLPLTHSGKINKKLLPEPDDFAHGNKLYVPPGNYVEDQLATIWKDLLHTKQLGVHDDFFELGGHSLSATRVVAAIRKQLHVELPVKDVFVYTTIARLALHLGTLNYTLVLPEIKALPRPELIPLSFSQERLWFIDKLEGSVHYHLPTVLVLKGTLNRVALEFALKEIINRHEVLRTVFVEKEGKAYQSVRSNDEWQLTEVDGSEFKNDHDGLQEYLKQLVSRPFDLSHDYMSRANLVTIDVDDYVMVLTMHHIASDAWSTSLIVKEVVELYAAFGEQRNHTLTPLEIQYADYSIWQRDYLQGSVLEQKLDYWKRNLAGVSPLQLITDHPRPAVWNNRGAVINFNIDKELAVQLGSISKQQGATLFMTLLAAFKVLLYRYTGQTDVCVGTSNANRSHHEIEDLIGFFVNLLALRSEVNGASSFIDLLQQVKSTTLGAYQHQDVPFEKVVEAIVEERDRSRNPLFQVLFVLLNTPEIPRLQLGDITLSKAAYPHTTTQFDITFFVNETEEGLQGSVQYSTNLYNRQTIEGMIVHFKELLNSIVKSPQHRINALPMLSQADERQVLVEFNKTQVGYPINKTIIDLFEEQVLKTPGSKAIVFGEEELTYQQLNEKANQLAHYLRSRGVKEETLVPICIERSLELVVGILGILKAGGAYVPIDPKYPANRIRYTIEDTNAALVVTSREGKSKLTGVEDVKFIEIDETWAEISKHSSANVQANVTPHNLAYVIYTSGSTGKPKGVLLEHRNVVRLFETEDKLFDFNDKDVWTMFHSFCFDFSVWEMFGALFYGGRLVIVPEEVAKDVELFSKLLLRENVTILNQTPSAFYGLQDYFSDKAINNIHIRYVIFGGEALKPSKLVLWKQLYSECRLINMYGITETTVHVTFQEMEWQQIHSGRSIIGKPIPTLTAYILDSNQNLLPVGISGEMYIGGAGVARGYLNRHELTAEKFIKDPFSKEAGSTLYRTGDLGRWLVDGSIEYLGRIDEQVKIRGYRIELGEIESVLLQSGLVSQAVVLAKEDNSGNKRLVGYVVPGGSFDKEAVTAYLHTRLPEYMIPALWLSMNVLPLTSNGKIDKKALPDVDAGELLSNKYIAPQTELENELAQIWKDLLRVEKVGIEDNFFELGGDSILTIQLVSRTNRLGYNLQPKDIFIHQTIGRLSKVIAKRSVAEVLGEQGILKGEARLLPIQQWLFNQEPIDVSHFNQSVLLQIDKQITEPILSQTILQLTAYHDALRFKYQDTGKGWKQQYGDIEVHLLTEDLQQIEKQLLESEITRHANTYQRSLNIKTGEVIKAVWMQTPATEIANRLFIVIHHLAIDGVSWRILLQDLMLILDGLVSGTTIDLGSKSSSYRQFGNAIEKYSQSAALLSQKEYWQKAVESFAPALPVDNTIGLVRVKDISRVSVKLNAVQTQLLLQEVPRVYHTEINDILLSALAKTLCSWIGSPEVIIGLEGHGREDIGKAIDTSRTVGWFTSLYPVVLNIGDNNRDDDLIKSVKEQVRQVPGKGLGYGVLKYVNKLPALQGRDRWEIVFNYLGKTDNVVNKGKWISAAAESSGEGRSNEQVVHEKLSVTAIVQSGEMVFSWSYSGLHYRHETVEKLAHDIVLNLETLIAHCTGRLKKAGVVFTPSDFGLSKEITYQELDKFLKEEPDDKENILSF